MFCPVINDVCKEKECVFSREYSVGKGKREVKTSICCTFHEGNIVKTIRKY